MTLRDEIAAIVARIAEGDGYWNYGSHFGILDQEAVVNDILRAVVEHDDDVLEVFGDARQRQPERA